MDFTDFQIRKCPPTAMYVPNFITIEEEERILSHIKNAPKPKWTQLKNRRLINYGGIPHPNGMIPEEIPPWLQNYVSKINNLGIFENQKANHVLVNEYQPGQGIMAHTDGPMFYPLTTTISCGSHTVLEFIPRRCLTNEEPEPRLLLEVVHKLLLERRSLLILKDAIYTDFMHSISECNEDILCDKFANLANCGAEYRFGDKLKRDTRLSLTIRNVPKTSKMMLRI